MPADSCHLCGGSLDLLDEYSVLRRVTSDCRSWPAGGRLAVCRVCDTVQKPTDLAWQEECRNIYASYAIYQQAAGAEQLVFGPAGAAAPRSRRLVERLSSEHALLPSGRLLDIGCGNGAFMRAFGAAYPGWRLTGTEVGETNRNAVEALPGVEQFHTGDLGDLAGGFDLVVMIHCLEHIPDPAGFLRRASGLLTLGGLMLIQVPYFHDNAFDLLIADHCTHFSPMTLAAAAEAAGLAVETVSPAWVAKEISLVARVGQGSEQKPSSGRGLATARAQIGWLRHMIEAARERPAPVGVFGTSIAGSWAAAELEGRVAFFLDEDRNRIHHPYMGLPVLAPTDSLPAHSCIVLTMPPSIAAGIAARLPHLDFLLPPG